LSDSAGYIPEDNSKFDTLEQDNASRGRLYEVRCTRVGRESGETHHNFRKYSRRSEAVDTSGAIVNGSDKKIKTVRYVIMKLLQKISDQGAV
jgi:hypothetical protein